MVFAVALSFVVLVMMTNLIVFQYGRGAVRAALDEGVRRGTREPVAAEECEARAREVVQSLLGGPMGEGVSITCAQIGGQMQAQAEVVFRSWVPGVPDWSFQIGAAGVKEEAPE
ncbi:MAG: hypothetical protein ACRDQW_18880 [Haloechinothrix sp.]